MGKVIAVGPGGKAQAPVRDDRYRPILELVRTMGLLKTNLLSPICKTHEEADDVRRGLYRSAFYFCTCGARNCTRKHSNINGGCPDGGQRLGCTAKIVRDEHGALRVQFRLTDKQEAMRYVIERYGPDPDRWPYFAKRKRTKE